MIGLYRFTDPLVFYIIGFQQETREDVMQKAKW